ncbi:MAG: lysophospholipid acyltransferase family protein, partial [Planctomycetes bacterium]|nr:lysophospholipid acyltransferase family protein [Planctomycetota bacterium]
RMSNPRGQTRSPTLAPRRAGPGPFALLRRAVERLLGLTELVRVRRRIAERIGAGAGLGTFLRETFAELGIRAEVPAADLERVPRAGPLLVVANHPHGLLDGLLLANRLQPLRADLRILGNRWLARFPELRDSVIPVDPIDPAAGPTNVAGMRTALRHLQGGGCLLVFPAGKVAARSWRQRGIHDDAWSPTIARLQQRSGATVLPIHIAGSNSRLFQLAGLIHRRLRTWLLVRETLNKRGSVLHARIGNPIAPAGLTRFPEGAELVAYLRLRTEILARRQSPGADRPARRRPSLLAAVAPSLGRGKLARDVGGLLPSQRLATLGPLEAWYAYAPQIPHVLREIGRLRELTFRAVGEGTGRPIDLDEFDSHYVHLFLWNPREREVVGAYRIGHVEHILVAGSRAGLYTHTLYDYDERFLAHVTPGLELGRSFVVAAWQRQFQPLLLLWRGIASYVARQPDNCVLFGAVSISDRHHDVSKHLMLDHLSRYMHPELSMLVQPRQPVPVKDPHLLPLCWTDAMVADLGTVSAMVAEIEAEARGVPVLLREYLKLGGQLVGLNVDPNFGSSITALVVLDLRRTDPRLLGRYMG